MTRLGYLGHPSFLRILDQLTLAEERRLEKDLPYAFWKERTRNLGEDELDLARL